VADQGDIATVIGRRPGIAVQAVPQQTFSPLGPVFAAEEIIGPTGPESALAGS